MKKTVHYRNKTNREIDVEIQLSLAQAYDEWGHEPDAILMTATIEIYLIYKSNGMYIYRASDGMTYADDGSLVCFANLQSLRDQLVKLQGKLVVLAQLYPIQNQKGS